MSSAATAFVQATRKHSQKVPRTKSGTFWFPGSLGWIPMFPAPFNSSCAALQRETETKFFHRAVSKLHAVKNSAKIIKLLFHHV